jgi:polysaccharide export outer membrane protein
MLTGDARSSAPVPFCCGVSMSAAHILLRSAGDARRTRALVLIAGLWAVAPTTIPAQIAARSSFSADSRAAAHPGDVIRLRIWREPDMSGDFTVDAAGMATFPRLGPMQVASIPADSLQRLLIARYATYLNNPSVEVTLLRRVRVTGAVKTPGLYNADQTMRVRDVLALAGGATAEGHMDQVRLDRGGQSMRLDLRGAALDDEMALRSGDQLYVPQRSWLARNTPLVAAIVSVSGGLLVALAAR